MPRRILLLSWSSRCCSPRPPRSSSPHARRRRGPGGRRVQVAEIRVDGAPTDIALAQGRAWVPDRRQRRADARSTAGRRRPCRTTYRAGGGALRLASDGFSIWLAGAAGDQLTAVDPLFGGRAARRTVGVGGDAVDVAAGRDGVWVSNGARGTVTRIDPVAGRRIGEPIRTGRFPTALAVGNARRLGRQLGRRHARADRPAREPRRRPARAGGARPAGRRDRLRLGLGRQPRRRHAQPDRGAHRAARRATSSSAALPPRSPSRPRG